MAELVEIEDIVPYRENLLHPFWNFESTGTWTKTGTGSVAYSPNMQYYGNRSLLIRNTAFNTANTVAFYPNDSPYYQYANKSGYMEVSFFLNIDGTYDGAVIPFSINVFKDTVLYETYTIQCATDYGFQFGTWNRVFCQFPYNSDELVEFTFELGYDDDYGGSLVEVFMSGFAMTNKILSNGFPSFYMPVVYEKNGWGRYVDNVHTSGSPLTITAGNTGTITNNANTKDETDLPVYVTSLFNAVSNKITPANTDDYYHITIFAKVKSTVSNDVFTIGLDVGGSVGVTFKQSKMLCVASGTAEDVIIQIPARAFSEFYTNGGIPKLTAGAGNISIYDISFEIERTYKS